MPYELIQLPPPDEHADSAKSHLVFSVSESKQGTVGRHSTCDFRIRSDDLKCFVSRKHAQLSIKQENLLVQDLSSANGTFINGVMLKPYCETELKAGDCIAFGCKKEKAVPGSKHNDGEMPFRFKVQEIKIMTNRPVTGTKVKRKADTTRKNAVNPGSSNTGRTNGKRSDERDSGFDDQEVPKKKQQENLESQSKATITSAKPQNHKSSSSFEEDEEAGSEDGGAESEDSYKPSSKRLKTATRKRKNTVTYDKESEDEKEEESDSDSDDSPNDDCSSYECIMRTKKGKKGKVVSWVQCDSCDRWFHTVCVGCDYDQVKLSSHQFHCGLC